MFVIVNTRTGRYFKRERNGARRWVTAPQATQYRKHPLSTLFYMHARGVQASIVRI